MNPADRACLQCHLVAFYIKATCNQKQRTKWHTTELQRHTKHCGWNWRPRKEKFNILVALKEDTI